MTNRPKAIGTATETAVVRYLQPNGYPFAERLVLHGALDEGDIQACPGFVVEVKGGKAAESASDAQIAAWLAEAEVERVNRGADICPLVTKRKGKGAANAGSWWVYLPGWTYFYLADEALSPSLEPSVDAYLDAALPPIRITLAELVVLARRAGYGNPL